MNDLDQTLRLAAAASAGPWTTTWHGTEATGPASLRIVEGPRYYREYDAPEMDAADADFIAHARTALPAYAAALTQILRTHMPFDVYDECDCDEATREENVDGHHIHVNDIGWTCKRIATVCRACCCYQGKWQTEECMETHTHQPGDSYHCATAKIAAGVVR